MATDEGVLYRVEVVGGPWDGAPGLSWYDDGEHPPPSEIFVGRCPGDGSCGSASCSPRMRGHPSFWTVAEAVPFETIIYEKHDEYVQRVELATGDEFEVYGVAVYAIGGVDMLRSMTGKVEIPVPA